MAIKTTSLLLFTILLFSACRNNAPGESGEKELVVRLQCEPSSQDEAFPQSAVYAIVNQNKVKLGNISQCDSIPPASYEDHEIPRGALAAAGGWWAGAGDYFYAIQEDSSVAFYQGWVEEGQEEDSYHYELVASFTDGQFILEAPARKDELVGTYALSREAGSHILFVGLKEDSLKAEYFTTDGILPPVNQLNILMTPMQPEAAATLDINLATLNFTSGLGPGQFIRETRGWAVVLPDKQVQGQALKMEKILTEDYSLPVK